MKKDAVYLIVGAAAYGFLIYMVANKRDCLVTTDELMQEMEAEQARGYFSGRRAAASKVVAKST